MCGHLDNVIQSWTVVTRERHFPWVYNLWYIVLEIVPATFTQLEMPAIISHQNTHRGGRVPPVSSDSQWLVFRQIKISVSRALAQSPTHLSACHQEQWPGYWPSTGLDYIKGRIWKKPSNNAKFLSATRISPLACSRLARGINLSWVLSELSHL